MTRSSTAPRTISLAVARRYLLGRQGLWPTRRWTGRDGALAAIRTLGAVQMDAVTIVARSHDLVLAARVRDYAPADLDALHEDRAVFDYGGLLAMHPIETLPYWRVHMARRTADKRYREVMTGNDDLARDLLALIAEIGPLTSRAAAARLPEVARGPRGAPGSYRSGSVIGRVLYHLWLTGELMTARRSGMERHYDLATRVAPLDDLEVPDDAATERWFAERAIRTAGLIAPGTWRSSLRYTLNRVVDRAEGDRLLAGLTAAGVAMPVTVEGVRGSFVAPVEDGPLLDALDGGDVPAAFAGSGPSTEDEVRLISPLDPLPGGKRAATFFGFEHVWEIYKPADKRRWGPFTMPLLWGDRLVGRLDPRLDRGSGVLHVNGVWLEDDALAADAAFVAALRAGLTSVAAFHGATAIEVAATSPASLRARLRL